METLGEYTGPRSLKSRANKGLALGEIDGAALGRKYRGKATDPHVLTVT